MSNAGWSIKPEGRGEAFGTGMPGSPEMQFCNFFSQRSLIFQRTNDRTAHRVEAGMRDTAFGICQLQMLRCGHCHFCHEHRCASPTVAHGLGDLGRDRAGDDITITGFRFAAAEGLYVV